LPWIYIYFIDDNNIKEKIYKKHLGDNIMQATQTTSISPALAKKLEMLVERFEKKLLAWGIFGAGQIRISQVHDRLAQLASENLDTITLDERNKWHRYLYFLSLPQLREKTESMVARDELGLLDEFSGFAEPEALKIFRALFEAMPLPDTSSLYSLTQSISGLLVFPKYYFRGALATVRRGKEQYLQPGEIFTPKHFEKWLKTSVKPKKGKNK
jgi:hypothetical protein